jgi:UbiD family decarboxylase
MPAPDLRSFLEDLRDHLEEDLLTIQEQVPLDYTSTAMALALEKQGHFPVLLFEHLQGHPGRLVANLFASRRVMAHSLGVGEEAFNARLGECLDRLIPVQRVPDGPVHEITLLGEQADLARLPVPARTSPPACWRRATRTVG